MPMTPCPPVSGSGRVQLLTFHVADLFLGIDVLKVQEVIRYQEMTNVPLAPPVVRGLINLRGQIVTAIDIRKRMKMVDRLVDSPPMNIVVRSEDGIVSLLVDEISDVIDVDKSCYEDSPQNMPLAQRELTQGLYKLKGKLLLVLDAERVLQDNG